MGEEIIQLYQKHFGLKASIARFYNVYGPHQLTEGGYTTLIGRWINNIKNGLPCEIYGDGNKKRDFTHVEDIVNGLISIMENKPGEAQETLADYSLAKHKLGWKPKKDLKTWINTFIKQN